MCSSLVCTAHTYYVVFRFAAKTFLLCFCSDDLGSTLGDSKAYTRFLEIGSHHGNCITFNLDQQLFSDQREKRKQTLMTNVAVLFRTPMGKEQIERFSRKMGLVSKKTVQAAFCDCTGRHRPYGYLILDNRQTSADEARLITNVFRDQYPPLCYLD